MKAAAPQRQDARLLRYLEEQQQRVDDARRVGYELGRADGWQAGHDAAHQELADEWRRVHERVQQTARTPTHDELERLRRTPGGAIHQAALQRRGGREYEGGKVDAW
ncbi:hypothetical protein ACI2LC_17640 [Nonomuraea wenchangensis]|uniref:hypothetical protein n=1 Tax=Nonomuraea wenchangensis TaxID=568860 RepID=UPI00384F7A08